MKHTKRPSMYWVHVVVLLWGVLGISLPASAIMSSADMTDAAYDGDIETVKRLLAEGRDINDTYGCSENALHQAVLGEHLELVKFLLSKGININQRSCGGKPMDFAMRTGNAKIICVLLDHSVKPETRYGEISIQAALGNTKKVQQLLEQETDRKELLESSLLVIRLGKPKMLPLFVPSKTPATKAHFMAAVAKGDVESAKYLIKHGFSFDNSGDIGRDAVVSAIQNGRVPMLRWLLKQKISPAKDPKEDGRSPLEHALRTGNAEIVDLLLSHGAKLHFKGKEAEKQLYRTVCSGNVELASRFLSKGVNPNTINPDDVKSQDRLLHLAAGRYDLPMVRALVKAGADVHAKQKFGYTPLGCSIDQDECKLELIQLFLDAGAKADIPNQIIAAACSRQPEVVKLLVKHGADVNAVYSGSDNNKAAPLHYAACWGPKEMIAFLLAKGARIHAKDAEGKTPLFWAVSGDSPERIAQLLKAGARKTDLTTNGQSLLHFAVQEGSEESIVYLLKAGANPNTHDKKGRTPLHQAVLLEDPSVLAFLLAHSKSLNINAVDADGRTPLHYAVYLNHLSERFSKNGFYSSSTQLDEALSKLGVDVILGWSPEKKNLEAKVNMLRQHKADPTIQDKHGKTPAMWKWPVKKDAPQKKLPPLMKISSTPNMRRTSS